MSGVALLAIFVLAVFVGFEVVSKVSTTLHTPLMSGANAIHGIILVGAVLVTGHADSPLALVAGLLATVLATVNLVGGFVVTDRMLEMFKGRSAGNASSRKTLPGFIPASMAAVTSSGARRPGTAAVVTSTSVSATYGVSSSCWRTARSADSSRA